MAYYADDEEKQETGGGGAPVSKPGSGLISGGSMGGSSQSAPGEAAKQTTPGNQASPFVGIKEYLNANKQQSGKLGGQVGSFVGGRIDQAGEALKGAEQNFGQQVDQNTVKLDQNLINQIKADPTKVAQNQQTLQQAKAMQKAYAGPTDFQSNQAYQTAAPTVQKAQTTAQNLGNAQGQKQILTEQQLETRGGKVNRGAATLDQALLQASPEAREALKPTQEKGAALKGNIDQTIANAMQKVSGAQAQSQATNKAMQDLYNQQFAEHQAALNQRAAQANQEVQAYNASLAGRLANGDLNDQDLSYLGISRGDLDALKGDFAKYTPEGLGTSYAPRGMNELASYLRYSTPQATAANVASQSDYAKAQALRELAGFGPDYLQNAAQANTFNRDAVDFDQAAARNYINDRKGKAMAELEKLKAQGYDVDQIQQNPSMMNQILMASILGGPQAAQAAIGLPMAQSVGGGVANQVSSWL